MADVEMLDAACTPTTAGKHDRREPDAQLPADGLHATPFAGPYRSTYTQKVRPEIREVLHHVNCNYLSTKGKAPSLVELKQHAHSLAVLINDLSLSDDPICIEYQDGSSRDEHEHSLSGAFDYLTNLTKPYTNDSPDHNRPLASLLNTLESTQGPSSRAQDICPLHQIPNSPSTGPALPYSTHHALISHANAALELLNHDLRGMGGILSILPAPGDGENLALAQSTLLGQLLLYVERLVERLHDLEIQYANSLDVLASEAVVPSHTILRLGSQDRGRRELVYPQDRFVLANCGEDVWQSLNREFEEQEKKDETRQGKSRSAGVAGVKMWKQRTEKQQMTGMTIVDLKTRYLRLKGEDGRLKTVFVMPAWENHPGVRVTRRMESQPTVVVIPEAQISERASLWEMRQRAEMEELHRLRTAIGQIRQRSKDLTAENKRLNQMLTIAAEQMGAQKDEIEQKDKKLRRVRDLLERDPDLVKVDLMAQAGRLAAAEEEVGLQRADLKQLKERWLELSKPQTRSESSGSKRTSRKGKICRRSDGGSRCIIEEEGPEGRR